MSDWGEKEPPAVVLCSDVNYAKHVKYMVRNIRDRGQFTGKIYLISPDIKQEDLRYDENLVLVPCSLEYNHFYYKYHLFGDLFKSLNHWGYLYLDLDCLIQKPLATFFEKYRFESVVADFEPFTMKQILHYDDPGRRYSETESKLDSFGRRILDKPAFNAGVMWIHGTVIQNHSYEHLREISREFAGINFHAGTGSDQPIFNREFFLNYQYGVVDTSDIVFWRDKDIADATIVHFCHEDGPWQNTNYSSILGMRYVDYYQKITAS